MNRVMLTAALAVALAGAAFGAVPASAQTTTDPVFWNCRASALSASVAGNDRVEPLVANGNPNTGQSASPDFKLCAKSNNGLTNLATQLGIPTDVLSARTASAVTSIDPEGVESAKQTVVSAASVEDLKLPLGGSTVILGVGAATSQAVGTCVDGQPQVDGTSQLTNVTLGGFPVSLDQLVTSLSEALAPLGPIVDIKVNEKVKEGTSTIVRALHVKVLRDAGSAPLVDVIVAESKVTAPEDVCKSLTSGSTTGPRACPLGSELDAPTGFCVIRGKGTNGSDLVIGRPFQGPSGGRVIALQDARRDARYKNSPCVKATGTPRYVVVGTNGRDRLTGTNAKDRLVAIGGNDSVSGGRGADCIDGGAGRDVLSGSIGSDRIYGGSGNDALTGGSQNDRLSGGSGNDTINAGYGADRVFGGAGRDFVNVATAGRKATVSCGAGRDKVRFNNEEKRNIRRDCEVQYLLADKKRS